MDRPASQDYLDDKCSGDGGVENFVGEKHLRAGFGQGGGVEVKESQ
jgi:hypothetical protein